MLDNQGEWSTKDDVKSIRSGADNGVGTYR